jgi:hypothetical protein
MKKLSLVLVMLVMLSLSLVGVHAEGEIVEVATEPSAFDNWVAVMSDWASLKNFIVTSGGLATLITLGKLRGVYKYFKSPSGLAAIEDMFVKVLGKVTDKPELVMKLGAIIVEMPIIKNILTVSQRKADIYALELQGKILDIEAKISAEVYEGTKLQEATAYLTKLRTEYENSQLN